MAMVGFSFTKISAERKQTGHANNIESNAGIVTVMETSTIDPKKTILKFDFTFTVKYEPAIGRIELAGEVVELYDKELGSKILEQWNSEKKIHPKVMQDIMNIILARSNIQAVVTSRDVGLPSPVQMPRINVKTEAKDAKSEAPVKETKAKLKK